MANTITLKNLKDAMKRVNADPATRKLGSCDATMGIKAASKCYAVTFDAFAVTDVREIDQDGLVDVDFYIEMSKKDWTTFLEALAGEQPATLNDLDLTRQVVNSRDERHKLTFLQYHLSFQHFFEVAASA